MLPIGGLFIHSKVITKPIPTPTISISISPTPNNSVSIQTKENISISPPPETSTPTPIPYLTAKGEYSDQDKKVLIQIKFPKYGGAITGVVVGVCNSSELNGQYDSNNNEISGVVTGKCDNLPKFQNSVARVAFRGKVDMPSQKIEIDFDGGLYPNAPYNNTSLHISYTGKHLSLTIK